MSLYLFYWPLTLCKVSEKTNEHSPKYLKTNGPWTDHARTNRGDYYGPYWVNPGSNVAMWLWSEVQVTKIISQLWYSQKSLKCSKRRSSLRLEIKSSNIYQKLNYVVNMCLQFKVQVTLTICRVWNRQDSNLSFSILDQTLKVWQVPMQNFKQSNRTLDIYEVQQK